MKAVWLAEKRGVEGLGAHGWRGDAPSTFFASPSMDKSNRTGDRAGGAYMPIGDVVL